mgnify:CR=1 FL=1
MGCFVNADGLSPTPRLVRWDEINRLQFPLFRKAFAPTKTSEKFLPHPLATPQHRPEEESSDFTRSHDDHEVHVPRGMTPSITVDWQEDILPPLSCPSKPTSLQECVDIDGVHTAATGGATSTLMEDCGADCHADASDVESA